MSANQDFFWGQRYRSLGEAKLISRNSNRFAGYESLNTFVELTRDDQIPGSASYEERERALQRAQRGLPPEEPRPTTHSTDYGYLSVVRGDPDAKVDTPDLMFYVIRTAQNASAKGIEPVGKEEFLELAQTIAASVKRRPTSVGK